MRWLFVSDGAVAQPEKDCAQLFFAFNGILFISSYKSFDKKIDIRRCWIKYEK